MNWWNFLILSIVAVVYVAVIWLTYSWMIAAPESGW